MLDYLKELLGMDVILIEWDKTTEFPVYLRRNKEYYTLQIEEQSCVVVKVLSHEFNLLNYNNLIEKLKTHTDENIILWLDDITTYQRQVLVKNKIAFIVPNSQMYVPLLGMCFKERMQNKISKVEKLTAMAQYILLYIIYNPNQEKFTQAELATQLNISAMNVSRGVAELSALKLINIDSIGRNKYVEPVADGRELYKLSKEYMQSPIQKKVHVRKEEQYMDYIVAGEEALAIQSMLNPPKIAIRAIDKKKFTNIPVEHIVDPDWELNSDYIEFELWKYDPLNLSRQGVVDVISLALSLQDKNDERIDEQIQEMVEELYAGTEHICNS